MSEPEWSVAEHDDRGAKLPRGRHGIPPDQVIANQRQRMLAAAASLFVEHGYASFSVGDVTARARVSRSTFYKLFDDKGDCVLAAHRNAFEQLDQALVAACLSQNTWPDSVAAAIAAALELAAEKPAEASLLAFAPNAAEPRLAKQALSANSRLLRLLRAGRKRCPEVAVPSELVEQALLLGAVQVIGAELLEGGSERLPRLVPEITEILLTPYLGRGQAKRVAAMA